MSKTNIDTTKPTLPDEVLVNKIYEFRDQKVMLDSDLAELYGVETKRLNERIRRNKSRFPIDFMFQLTQDEWISLRSQIATSKDGRGGRTYSPNVFTEHGVLMLSSILNSEQAVQVNIQIMRIFTRIRHMVADYTSLQLEIAEVKSTVEKINKKQEGQDKNVELIFEYIDRLQEQLETPSPIERKRIGYELGRKRE